MYSMAQSQQQAQAQQQAQGPNSLSSPASFGSSNAGPQPVSQEYETTLKDFNSAFRSTPYASPAHPGSDMDSGLGLGDSTSSMDIERGINWSSVLSLSSQSELDPLNNNTFATEAWPSTANTPTTLSSVQGTTLTDISSSTVSVTSSGLTQLTQVTCVTSTNTTTVNGTSFDDIGWKLSADDVLKAFPNDENLFGAVTGPWNEHPRMSYSLSTRNEKQKTYLVQIGQSFLSNCDTAMQEETKIKQKDSFVL